MIEALGVVVPAHNEESMIDECLEAIARACAAVSDEVTTYVVLVLDSCSDRTRAVAARHRRAHHEHTEVDFRNVGRARAHGARRVIEHFAQHAPENIWLATTDADSRVPATWLEDQLTLARSGVDAVAGTVRVADWTGYTQHFIDAFTRFYERHGGFEGHAHVHGANLGMRASAYLEAGGFAPLATGEDHALWNALQRAGRRVSSTRALEVETSARRLARAPLGFSHFLAELQP